MPKQKEPLNPETTIFLNKYVPGFQSTFRLLVASLAELDFRWFYDTPGAAAARKQVEEVTLKHMKKHVPERVSHDSHDISHKFVLGPLLD